MNNESQKNTTVQLSDKVDSILEKRYVLWFRIDQKACLKCIYTAGTLPTVSEATPLTLSMPWNGLTNNIEWRFVFIYSLLRICTDRNWRKTGAK
jgi:hypothetical protein